MHELFALGRILKLSNKLNTSDEAITAMSQCKKNESENLKCYLLSVENKYCSYSHILHSAILDKMYLQLEREDECL